MEGRIKKILGETWSELGKKLNQYRHIIAVTLMIAIGILGFFAIYGTLEDSDSFISSYYTILWYGLVLVVIALYILIFIKKIKIENIFLVAILAFGILYLFIITPYSKPDEEVHINYTYHFSNKLLGIKEQDKNYIYKRQEDIDVRRKMDNYPSKETYEAIYEGIFGEAGDTTLVGINWEVPSSLNPLLYGPSTIGVSVARICNLNGYWLLFLGSYFNLLTYALLVYFGMKKLPFGKILLFLIATLPMSIQQAVSFSIDPVVSGIVIFFVCYCLYLIYDKDKIQKKDIIITLLFALLTSLGKGGVYGILAALVLLVPRKKFFRKSTFYLWVAGCFSLVVVGFIVMNLAAFTSTSGIGTTEKVLTWIDAPGYTMSDVLGDLKHVAQVYVGTFFERSGFYIESFIGEPLGALNISIGKIFIYLYFLLLCLAAFREEKKPQFILFGQKVFISLLCLGSVMLILLSMLVDWTPKYYVFIEGVQGRYFLPLGLPIFLLLRNSQLVYKKYNAYFFKGAFMILQFLIVCSLIYRLM